MSLTVFTMMTGMSVLAPLITYHKNLKLKHRNAQTLNDLAWVSQSNSLRSTNKKICNTSNYYKNFNWWVDNLHALSNRMKNSKFKFKIWPMRIKISKMKLSAWPSKSWRVRRMLRKLWKRRKLKWLSLLKPWEMPIQLAKKQAVP